LIRRVVTWSTRWAMTLVTVTSSFNATMLLSRRRSDLLGQPGDVDVSGEAQRIAAIALRCVRTGSLRCRQPLVEGLSRLVVRGGVAVREDYRRVDIIREARPERP
jgi:hypothetical protein